ncbi:MAG: sigma 54-interacting transcriptional regulator, partial [bacterium]
LLSHFTTEQASDAIIWIDSEGVIIHANKAACQLFGDPSHELIGKKIYDLTPEITEVSFQKDWLNLEQQKKLIFEGYICNKDGEKIPVEISANLIEFEGKEYCCGFIRDITKRKESENELKEALAEVEKLKDRLHLEVLYLRREIKLNHNFNEIITKSDALTKILHKVEQVAATDSTVLIQGETGTGKELIARAIHNTSKRRNRPMIKINCAAIPPNLIESELFGHEKGAFTGAYTRKIGRFELAHETTIFLDEIGELPLDLQVKLLQVLQEGEFSRIGSTKTLKADVRIIAATNRDLEKAIDAGTFREDLFYRLNVFPIALPPLRERKEDIPLLAEYFTKKYSKKIGKQIDTISKHMMERLVAYHWPGNVRELENVIERSVIISEGTNLDCSDWIPPKATIPDQILVTLQEMEKNYIIRVLESTNWRVSGEKGAAKILGMKRTTLESKMKKLGISHPK